jgi:hypothetical protein
MPDDISNDRSQEGKRTLDSSTPMNFQTFVIFTSSRRNRVRAQFSSMLSAPAVPNLL